MTTEELARDYITFNEAWMKAALVASVSTDKACSKEAATLWTKKDEAYQKLKERFITPVVPSQSMNEPQKAVLMGMLLLGATNAERSAYENVKDGKAAWDVLVKDGYIVKECGFYILSDKGIRAAREK